jgi:hypothetical protein
VFSAGRGNLMAGLNKSTGKPVMYCVELYRIREILIAGVFRF